VGDSLNLWKMGKPVWLIVIAILLAIFLAYTAFYTIAPGHQGIILRFGRYSGMVLPGLHFKIPFGVDTVFKVHTEQVDTESFGFKSVRPGIRTQYEKGGLASPGPSDNRSNAAQRMAEEVG
jgi:membrane protease subunit HflK